LPADCRRGGLPAWRTRCGGVGPRLWEHVTERVTETCEAAGRLRDAFELRRAHCVRDYGIGERDRERPLDFVAMFGHVIEEGAELRPAFAVEAAQFIASGFVARRHDLRGMYAVREVEIRGEGLGLAPGQFVDRMGRLRRSPAARELARTGRVAGFPQAADERVARGDEVRRCGPVELVEG